MRILGPDNAPIECPDTTLGRLVPEKILVASHPAVEAVEEISHYEVVAEYPNGGKDVALVVDRPGIPAADAWDEYEDILRFVPFTEEELAAIEAERNKPTAEERISELEEALQLLLSGETT